MRTSTRARRPRGWKYSIITAGILALAAIAVPAQAFAAPSAPSTGSALSKPGCPGLYVIGARGSGQAYDVNGPFRGLGPEVDKTVTVVDNVVKKSLGITASIKAIDYPALSTDVLKPSKAVLTLIGHGYILLGLALWYKESVEKYLKSITAGTAAMVADAEHDAGTCPETPLVLAGYSQGAIVAHQAEVELKRKSSRAFGNIAGTLLIADGDRVENTKAHEFGTSKSGGEGIETYLYLSDEDAPLPNGTANICDADDIVCDISVGALWDYKKSIAVHTSYAKCDKDNKCTYLPVLTTAATWVGNVVVRLFREHGTAMREG